MIELTFKSSNGNICTNSPVFASLEFYAPLMPPRHSLTSEKTGCPARRHVLSHPAAAAISPVLYPAFRQC